MTITHDDLKEHVETDLDDDALDRLITDAQASIDDRIGPEGAQTIVLGNVGGDRYLFLPRPISSSADIASITERWGAVERALASDEWRWLGGRQLERLIGSGSTAGTLWGWWEGGSIPPINAGYSDVSVVIAFTPKPDARRDRVVIDLCRLALVYNGLSDERAGEYQTRSREDYQAEREKVLSELMPKVGFA